MEICSCLLWGRKYLTGIRSVALNIFSQYWVLKWTMLSLYCNIASGRFFHDMVLNVNEPNLVLVRDGAGR